MNLPRGGRMRNGLRLLDGSKVWIRADKIPVIMKRNKIKDHDVQESLVQDEDDGRTYAVKLLWHSKWTKKVKVRMKDMEVLAYDHELLRSEV